MRDIFALNEIANRLSLELISLDTLLATTLREIPTTLLRVGRIELDGVAGFQIGPVTVWHEPCGAGACA